MDNTLNQIKKAVYSKCNLNISDFNLDPESRAYNACSFKLNGKIIISRNAKVTPKKVGQFVTFWKRNTDGIIEPFNETDTIDFFIVNVHTPNEFGQFVFPKSILIKKGILSTVNKEGKRAFRVYPSWDLTKNKQAQLSQKWQLNYFYKINASTNFNEVSKLYNNK
ncbi:MepB family protein [Lutibacter sp. A80]|uniref:MepB family protein n=1 Tax=Lutibacter sp. A80 TaxID=2918453 RepID=UPI001F068282|nr:MepB family protein [Lutibacter sp. A80]UMB59664.1 MepB family protein [Lutibacter sp. A80]